MDDRFQPYIKLVEFLGKVLGKNSEVVLHDISDLNHSIIAIANGEVSGRTIGGPATGLIIDIIDNPYLRGKDYFCNYTGATSKGKKLSSSTFIIRDEKKNILGMLCINSDKELLIKARDMLNSFIEPETNDSEFVDEKEEISELFNNNVDELVEESIQKIIDQIGISPDRMSQQEKIDVVRKLYDMGVYNLKGSVAQTSLCLKISEPSVYRYLNMIKS